MKRTWMLAAAALAVGCGGKDPGVEGSEIPVPFESLSGGVVFASAVIVDSQGYDLFWVPVPQTPTIDRQPLIRLTKAKGNELQPSTSRGGKGIVFVREEDGIHLISASGRVSRVSKTDGTPFKDTLPALSYDGNKVAWVREDTSRPIGQTGFFETSIMVADFDGKNAMAVAPREGVVQDAPVFEPAERATRLAWSEFDATSLTPRGPQRYGIYVHDLALATGRYVCRDPEVLVQREPAVRTPEYRCFGQHLDWVKTASGNGANPVEDHIVAGQELLDVNITRGTFDSLWPPVVYSLQNQENGQPFIQPSPFGFFPAFPLSVSFSADRFVFDGLVSPTDGDELTLGLFISDSEGGGVWRLPLDGHFGDYDPATTSQYFFSVATPQFIP